MENYAKLKKYGKIMFIILAILIVLPIVIMLLNATILTIFNFGTYFGTFVRYIFNSIIC